MKRKNYVAASILKEAARQKLISLGVIVTVIGAVISSLLPPLVLAAIIDDLTSGRMISFARVLLYFALIALTGILDSGRESLLTILGQKITHALRSTLAAKLNRLDAQTLNKQEPGSIVSRFVSDVDTVETLFTSGIISMVADACKLISIFVIIISKTKGLAILLIVILPLLYIFTRKVQKSLLAAQLENRAAISRVTNHVPETIRCIRTIHTLGKEEYMKSEYDRFIGESYDAIEKSNFFDSIYSPVVLIANASTVALVMLMSASGNPLVLSFFGMSVGTAVAVINYITQIFTPIEGLGMEIQTIQSAIAGVRRINDFLAQEERWECSECADTSSPGPCISFSDVTFGYDPAKPVLKNLSFEVNAGEHVTLVGRTGAGKSTIFKLILGLYEQQEGNVEVFGCEASKLSDREKRRIFGYVEQSFHMVPGTIRDQITLFDESISEDMAIHAAQLSGLHETIISLEKGYDTLCTQSVFSQGQWQLLSIARAVAADPKILLLDEITANLDADTEKRVLDAISHVSEDRTVISISHRIWQHTGGRVIEIR